MRVHMISCRSLKTVLRSHLCCSLSITGRDAKHWISGSEEICCRQQLTRRSRRRRRKRRSSRRRRMRRISLGIEVEFSTRADQEDTTHRCSRPMHTHTHTHTDCSVGGYHLELKFNFQQLLTKRIPHLLNRSCSLPLKKKMQQLRHEEEEDMKPHNSPLSAQCTAVYYLKG